MANGWADKGRDLYTLDPAGLDSFIQGLKSKMVAIDKS